MSSRDDDDFESDRSAWIAFQSSAIAGFKPQKAKYKSATEYAAEVGEFSEAVANEAFARYKAAEADGFPFEELEEEEDEEEEDEDPDADERPRRRRRVG
jgi:hypothetical protein